MGDRIRLTHAPCVARGKVPIIAKASARDCSCATGTFPLSCRWKAIACSLKIVVRKPHPGSDFGHGRKTLLFLRNSLQFPQGTAVACCLKPANKADRTIRPGDERAILRNA